MSEDFPQPDRRGSVSGLSKRGFHRIAYVEWGPAESQKVAVCVHGLSRQGRDFDRLAYALAQDGWRVVCPDLVGRGRSEWLADKQEYNLPQYGLDLAAVIARTGAATVHWVGTSLGGLIGMVLAGQPNSPIRSLVVNDVGPFLPWQALNRLGAAVRNSPRTYPDFDAAVAWHRQTLAPFGRLTDAEWAHLTRHSLVRTEDDVLYKRADPDIIATFRAGVYFNLSLWTYWDAISCPVLVLRGAQSDLLTPATAQEMTRRGPHAELVEFPDCGHAPALMDTAQIAAVTGWLNRQEPG